MVMYRNQGSEGEPPKATNHQDQNTENGPVDRRPLSTEEYVKRAAACLTRLRAIAMLVLGNHHDVEDAVQCALIAGWANLAKLKDPAQLEAWLRRIVQNCARAISRAARRSARTGDDLDELSAGDSDGQSEPGLRSEVREVLEMLSAEEKEVIRLRLFEGLTLADAAAKLGLSVSGVQKRYQAALDRFRSRFERQGESA